MLSRKAEDYLETILFLIQEKGYARTKDIAVRRCVKPPSVTEMLAKLQKNGLVSYEKYEGAKLTPKGREIARTIKKKHILLRKFLKMIRVSSRNAEKDACMMEHELTQETVNQLSQFVSFVESFEEDPHFFKNYQDFCKTGKLPKCPKIKK
jgi:DtxR family Mn-dependent transcriptional regulator